MTDHDQDAWNITRLNTILDNVSEDYGIKIEGSFRRFYCGPEQPRIQTASAGLLARPFARTARLRAHFAHSRARGTVID